MRYDRRCALGTGARVLSLLTLAGCGQGHDVNLGTLVLSGSSGAGSVAPPALCSNAPCADHAGSTLFVDASALDTAPDAFDRGTEHAPGTDSSAEPAFVYPSDETMLPVNLTGLRFAWKPGQNTRFALDFAGPNTLVRVVTAETSFVPTSDEWAWIAESNRGGRIDVIVRALDPAAPGDVWRSNPIALYVSAIPLEASAYYWSTGSQGLMQASLAAARAVRFFTAPLAEDAGTCTGCHTVSRDGKRLAAGYDKNQLAEIGLPERTLILPLGSVDSNPKSMPSPDMMDAGPAGPPPAMMPKADKPPPLVWSTFSPDGKLLLTAGGGKLRLIDADTGAAVGADQGLVVLPDGTTATHPDWSPLGDQVAITLNGKGGDKQTEGGSIALLPYADGTFGAPRVLVPTNGDKDNDFFPSFSPDGRFIAYVNANGGSEEASSAELRLFDLATGTSKNLVRVNERVGGDDGVSNIGNTMPTWGPSSAGIYWLSFSSLRAYADLRPEDPKQDQLWLAALDPTLDDPGFAAFWLPFQGIAQGNHRAFWVASTELPAACCVELCDNGSDDDCDGTIDETDCMASCADREVCGNGIDDDCDCVVDDCSAEICDDGIDNDGDGKTDHMDLACGGK